MFNIYINKRLDHRSRVQLGLLHKHGSIFVYNIGVFFMVVSTLEYLSMKREQWKVMLSVKQKCLIAAW